MKNPIKVAFLAVISLLFVISTAYASPVKIENFNIQESNGDIIALVSLSNANTLSGIFTEVSFTIEELGTSKNVGVVSIDTNETVVKEFNLRDITDSFDLLKPGQTYQLTVTTDGDSATQSFLFGSEKDTKGLDLVIDQIEINNVEVTDIETLQVLNGEALNVQIKFNALQNFDDARIMAFIEGYEHSPIVGTTDIFQVTEGKTYVKNINLNLPHDIGSEKDYKLRIVGANDLSGLTIKNMDLYVDTQRHRVDILDLVMTPNSGVEPGQNIIANVRMKNRGQKFEDSTKVTVAVPELGIEESSYISNLDPQDVATSDDMLLFVPDNAQDKQYKVLVTLSYDDGYTSSTQEYTLNVLASRVVPDKNLLVSFKNNVDLIAGKATSFDVVVANPNEGSKPMSLATLDNSWADVEVSPSLAMVQAGSDATFKVTVTPKSAVSGEKELVLLVKEGSTTASQLSVQTYVAPTDSINWVNVVLAILLIIAIIILLALIVTIARRRNDNEEDSTSTEEYY